MCLLQGSQCHIGGLMVAFIAAYRLADIGSIALNIQNIIGNLESQTEALRLDRKRA